jgi:hypothetical protein
MQGRAARRLCGGFGGQVTKHGNLLPEGEALEDQPLAVEEQGAQGRGQHVVGVHAGDRSEQAG